MSPSSRCRTDDFYLNVAIRTDEYNQAAKTGFHTYLVHNQPKVRVTMDAFVNRKVTSLEVGRSIVAQWKILGVASNVVRRGGGGEGDGGGAIELFTALQCYRKQTASLLGCPVYHVFTNTNLDSIVAACPTNLVDLHRIRGFGPYKTATFGKDIVHICNSWQALLPPAALGDDNDDLSDLGPDTIQHTCKVPALETYTDVSGHWQKCNPKDWVVSSGIEDGRLWWDPVKEEVWYLIGSDVIVPYYSGKHPVLQTNEPTTSVAAIQRWYGYEKPDWD